MATATRTNERGTARRSARRRPTTLPFKDHVLDLRNEDPDLFEAFDTEAIARALYKAIGAPENVVVEAYERMLQIDRRSYDPSFDPKPRGQQVKAARPRSRDIADTILGSFKSGTVMRDGRQLREWTWGEFRTEYGGMAKLMARFADMPDDQLIGDALQ